MPRVQMIEERDQASADQIDVFDHIAASRGGRMIRPYAAMLHRPEIARAAADLGAVIRFESTVGDDVRELAIVTTAIERGCEFEWSSHNPLARDAGVSDATLDAVRSGTEVGDDADSLVVTFARDLCREGSVDDHLFGRVRDRLGEAGVVELAAIVGYYSMLALFMKACDAC